MFSSPVPVDVLNNRDIQNAAVLYLSLSYHAKYDCCPILCIIWLGHRWHNVDCVFHRMLSLKKLSPPCAFSLPLIQLFIPHYINHMDYFYVLVCVCFWISYCFKPLPLIPLKCVMTAEPLSLFFSHFMSYCIWDSTLVWAHKLDNSKFLVYHCVCVFSFN